MTEAQNFKGDSTELKMRASVEPAFDLVNAALDQFYAGGSETDAFYLMLYDEGRMPFSERIRREVFVSFIKKALENFPVIGTFESYLFILKEIFGQESDILLEVPAAGKLTINIDAVIDTSHEFIGRELIDGEYTTVNISTSDDDDLVFRGVSGIETEYELNLLFSEIMPAGIFPSITLNFISKFNFIADEISDTHDIIDSDGNQLIFVELGE